MIENRKTSLLLVFVTFAKSFGTINLAAANKRTTTIIAYPKVLAISAIDESFIGSMLYNNNLLLKIIF